MINGIFHEYPSFVLFFAIRGLNLMGMNNGRVSQREFILHPGAVVILAIDTDGMIIFERQYRHPLKRVFLELPAGKLDLDEQPLEAARRELLEETGCSAKSWECLGEIHPCTRVLR